MSPQPPATTSRRGRLPAAERAEREAHILDAALDELRTAGFERTTMAGIAKRGGASKETLYAWFGDRDGLFTAVIRRNGDQSVAQLLTVLDDPADDLAALRSALVQVSAGLLTLLTSPASVALNRAAIASPTLASMLLREGRHRVGPIIERFLAQASNKGVLRVDDPAEAFEVLYGLVIRDTQIRVLLGEDPPDPAAIRRRAHDAVERFLQEPAPRAT